MKSRSDGFLAERNIAHNSEIFDYIRELHAYLWMFIRAKNPDAGGRLEWYLDAIWPDGVPEEVSGGD